jgi:hypothetical protein
VIGRQPWISVYSVTGCEIDIILSLNNDQECIHSLIVVEKITYFTACSVVMNVLSHTVRARKNKQPNLHVTGDFSSLRTKITIEAVISMFVGRSSSKELILASQTFIKSKI